MKEYNNPFKYAEVVTDEDFIDREREIKELTADLLSGQNVILYAPRRFGKTSIISETFRRINNSTDKIVCIYVDIFGVMAEEELSQRIITQLIGGTYTTIDKMKNGLKELLTKITPQIVIENDNVRIGIIWDKKNMVENLTEIFDLPQRIAERKKQNIIIAFDEFQDIDVIDGKRIEKLLRSRIQHHKNVSYLFTGSKTDMITKMFGSVDRAFYKFGKSMPLGKIDDKWLRLFIEKKFATTKKKIEKEAIKEILKIVNGYPYFMQQLCHEVWAIAKNRRINKNDVHLCVEKIVRDNGDFYMAIFDELTRTQRALLIGKCKDPEMSIYSKKFLSEYGLPASSVQRAQLALEKKRIIENNEVSDVFFREWIKKRF